MPASGPLKRIKAAWDLLGRLDRCPAAYRDVFDRHGREASDAGLNCYFHRLHDDRRLDPRMRSSPPPVRRPEAVARSSEAMEALADLGLVVGWGTRPVVGAPHHACL